MKNTKATLIIEVMVSCPHCDSRINLMDQDDTCGTDHNDDSAILRQSCPIDGRHWSDSHVSFEIQDVQCSECKKEFNVNGMEW